MTYKAMYKSELADLAGVTTKTLHRWLESHQHVLTTMGVAPRSKLLPPQAVKYVCETFCIDLPD
mgnify:CR=1 FL=1